MRNKNISVFIPLLFSGVFGALIGGVAGAFYGSFFFPLIGTIFGALLGALGGWIAGLTGIIINHRFGYRVGGMVGAFLCALMVWRPTTVREYWTEIWLFALPILIAFLIGWRVDNDMADVEQAPFDLVRSFREGSKTSGARPYQQLRSALTNSDLLNWSLKKRCVWATLLLGIHSILLAVILQRI